ncbi:MAG: hypothetical protein HY721_07895 [Planctomycetes bacterium]|nr:hypothetical protein [Planctomycetota bacterium]
MRSIVALVLAACLASLTSCNLLSTGEAGGKSSGSGNDAAPFPAEGVDHLLMSVSVEVDIAGIGKDTVELEGTVAVHRSGPQGEGGKSMVGDMIGASLRGTSKVFGPVVGTQSPLQHSACAYVQEAPGKYKGHFDINGWFWIPQHDLFIYTGAPVRVEGVAGGIPPVGQKAEVTAKDIPLHDLRKPEGQPIGFLSRASGTVRASVGIAEHLKGAEVTVQAFKTSK